MKYGHVQSLNHRPLFKWEEGRGHKEEDIRRMLMCGNTKCKKIYKPPGNACFCSVACEIRWRLARALPCFRGETMKVFALVLLLVLGTPFTASSQTVADSIVVEVFQPFATIETDGPTVAYAGDTLVYHARLMTTDGVRTSGIIEWRIEPPTAADIFTVNDTTVHVVPRANFTLHAVGNRITQIRIGGFNEDSRLVEFGPLNLCFGTLMSCDEFGQPTRVQLCLYYYVGQEAVIVDPGDPCSESPWPTVNTSRGYERHTLDLAAAQQQFTPDMDLSTRFATLLSSPRPTLLDLGSG